MIRTAHFSMSRITPKNSTFHGPKHVKLQGALLLPILIELSKGKDQRSLCCAKNTPKTKRKLKPEQVFKVEKGDFERTAEKGMDFAWYAFNWLIPHLHPYYLEVAERNPDADVYLIEDNSGAHIKARRLLSGHPLQIDIKFAPHPGNSPDLHPIENIFDAFEDALQEFVPSGTSKEEVERAKEWVIDEWELATNFGQRLIDCCASRCFVKKARKCLKADGWNRFHG